MKYWKSHCKGGFVSLSIFNSRSYKLSLVILRLVIHLFAKLDVSKFFFTLWTFFFIVINHSAHGLHVWILLRIYRHKEKKRKKNYKCNRFKKRGVGGGFDACYNVNVIGARTELNLELHGKRQTHVLHRKLKMFFLTKYLVVSKCTSSKPNVDRYRWILSARVGWGW